MHEIFSVSRRKVANCCHIKFIVIYHNILTLQWKSTLFLNIPHNYLFLHKNICCGISCGYSLQSPCRDDCNEYPEHVFMENWQQLSLNYHQIPSLSVPLKLYSSLSRQEYDDDVWGCSFKVFQKNSSYVWTDLLVLQPFSQYLLYLLCN